MTADDIRFALVAIATLPATGFTIVYGLGSPWYKSLLGRALFTHALGMALLIDISVLYKFFGDDYAGRDVVSITVYAVIIVGTWAQFIALLRERARGRDLR
ncbi:MAG: hypothetical protein JWQ74_1412 [Marmoricola sp.]|nr:hypothetical protein [Marmoricola sp.]